MRVAAIQMLQLRYLDRFAKGASGPGLLSCRYPDVIPHSVFRDVGRNQDMGSGMGPPPAREKRRFAGGGVDRLAPRLAGRGGVTASDALRVFR